MTSHFQYGGDNVILPRKVLPPGEHSKVLQLRKATVTAVPIHTITTVSVIKSNRITAVLLRYAAVYCLREDGGDARHLKRGDGSTTKVNIDAIQRRV